MSCTCGLEKKIKEKMAAIKRGADAIGWESYDEGQYDALKEVLEE